jgi:bleomycin hydrolase
MTVIFRIVGICLGVPPETFVWEYYDKSKNYNSVGPVTGPEFYEKYVKPYFNVDDKVCLVTDPRSTNPFGKIYTVDCLGNVMGGRPTIYNNQPPELLMMLCADSIKNNEPVWFGCEVSKRFSNKAGIEDIGAHDFKNMFGTDIQVVMSKADRLLYAESSMSHAMVFTAVSYNVSDEVFSPFDELFHNFHEPYFCKLS